MTDQLKEQLHKALDYALRNKTDIDISFSRNQIQFNNEHWTTVVLPFELLNTFEKVFEETNGNNSSNT